MAIGVHAGPPRAANLEEGCAKAPAAWNWGNTHGSFHPIALLAHRNKEPRPCALLACVSRAQVGPIRASRGGPNVAHALLRRDLVSGWVLDGLCR